MSSLNRQQTSKSAPDRAFPPESLVLAGLLADRFSCRAFKPDPVEPEVIARLFEIAQMSASWCNSQPWTVTVTRGEETERFRQALADQIAADEAAGVSSARPDIPFPQAYTGVYQERRREVGWQLYESVGVPRGDREASQRQARENFRLFGAPHVLIIHSERDLGVYGAVDCGLYLGTLLLAAQSLGLGMIPQAALANYSDVIRNHFDVPDNLMCVVGASFGYADEDHPANRFRSRRAAFLDNVKL